MCFICKVSIQCAIYAKCPYYVLYLQVSLLCALYARWGAGSQSHQCKLFLRGAPGLARLGALHADVRATAGGLLSWGGFQAMPHSFNSWDPLFLFTGNSEVKLREGD